MLPVCRRHCQTLKNVNFHVQSCDIIIHHTHCTSFTCVVTTNCPFTPDFYWFINWRFGAVGSDVGQINEVTLYRARLVLEWVTVSGSTPSAGNLSQSNQLPRSTQPRG